jgi:hypothetical protein
MQKIKLFEIEGLKDGTRRFQTQLSVGSNVADFVMGVDLIMKCWRYGDCGTCFYPYDGPYKIVRNKSDMNVQPL